MNISDAEKTVINGLTRKDESTIASTDLVQLYAQDGTPNGKISKADLMDAVKASLPALLSDGSTNGGSVLSIIDGALKTRTDANLASVLGVLKRGRLDSVDFNAVDEGLYTYNDNCTNMPMAVQGYLLMLKTNNLGIKDSALQIALVSGTLYERTKWTTTTSWTAWKSVTLT